MDAEVKYHLEKAKKYLDTSLPLLKAGPAPEGRIYTRNIRKMEQDDIGLLRENLQNASDRLNQALEKIKLLEREDVKDGG